MTTGTFARDNLNKQGFGYLDDEAKTGYALALRFTPGVSAILVGIGLIKQSPAWLGAMALVALSGALLPNGMVVDLVYNLGVRHLFGAPRLPPTPKPRRFSYGLSTSLLLASALSFHHGLPALGVVLGGSVLLGATVLATTLWCLGSWWYRLLFRAETTG